MAVYINRAACISHHNTIDENYFFDDLSSTSSVNKLHATEPAYKEFIPATSIRRMSHVVKMGVSAAMMSMKKTGLEKVDAIITGTGMGCYEDTDLFLRSMLDNKEQLLTPTAFIQSTHNTVAGQIALTFKCTGYNFTYVHQNLSFEYALLDAMMLLANKEAENVLVGGIDEITPSVFELLFRAGHIKKAEDLQTIWNSTSTGYCIGEGASFFNISSNPKSSDIAKIGGVKCFQQIKNANELLKETETFLEGIGLKLEQIDIVLSGNCGDEGLDKKISEFNKMINLPIDYFKLLCGEYFTASGFAMWLGANCIKKQIVPSSILTEKKEFKTIKHILIVNHYHDKQYSLMCISEC